MKDRAALKRLIKKGNIRFDADGFSPSEQMNVRREIITDKLNISLNAISEPVFDVDAVSTKNCENLIGKVEVPLGIVGPLKIKGDFAKGEFYVPMATTEGALIASTNRGAKAIFESGGVRVYIEKSGITRSPVFVTSGIGESRKLVDLVKNNKKVISQLVQKTDKYIKLISVSSYVAGRNVFLRFRFDTGDAMGMNMVTIACDNIAREFVEKRTGAKCVSLSGNVCIDKKPAWINKIEGRGFGLNCDVIIPKKVVNNILKTTSEKVEEVYQRKIMLGSSVSGAIGFNAHHANVVAAIFLATGQDPAHTVEGSQGTTYVERLDNSDLYFSVSVPSLVVGTVGGGTQLATQKEALSILGVSGGGNPPGTNSKKFAEIITATILAGEISLISALASSDLAKAHRKFGRGENVAK